MSINIIDRKKDVEISMSRTLTGNHELFYPFWVQLCTYYLVFNSGTQTDALEKYNYVHSTVDNKSSVLSNSGSNFHQLQRK